MSIFRYMLSFDRIHRKHWTQNSPTYIWFYAIYFDHVCMLISFAQEPTWIHTKKVSKKKRPLLSLSLSLSLLEAMNGATLISVFFFLGSGTAQNFLRGVFSKTPNSNFHADWRWWWFLHAANLNNMQLGFTRW